MVAALLLASGAVRAEESQPTYEFDLPSQSLADSLKAFARTAGQQLVFDDQDIRGRSAPALAGRFTASDALSALLNDSGMQFERTASDVWVIRPTISSRFDRHRIDDIGILEEVVVAGTTSSNRTVLQSSVAVTVADRETLNRKAPRSTAQALELIPGIYVETSGGEVLNNFTARGLPGGGQTFVQVSEDGLPVFYTPWLADAILKPDLSIERLESVRGGTSGVLTVQGAGATANFITRKATRRSEGTLQLTSSDFGTKRADVWLGGPFGDGWRFTFSGFYRDSDGVRDPGYSADKGGAVRGSIEKLLDSGQLGINFKMSDDRNTFLTPIALREPNDPKEVAGLDPLYGIQYSRDNAVQRVRVSPATGRTEQVTDLTDGLHSNAMIVGYHFETEFAPQWQFRSKGRYVDFDNDFNALFSRGNETLIPARQRLDPERNSDVRQMLERFAPQGAVAAALQVVSTGELIVGSESLNSLNGNGLTADTSLAGGSSARREYTNDASIVWENDWNSLTAGLLYFDIRGSGSSIGDATFISEVVDNPRRLNIVAVDSANQVIGYLTENGLLNYANGADSNIYYEARSRCIYLNDELRATQRWRFDAGVRFEWYDDFVKEGIISSDPLAVQGAFERNGQDVDNIIANNYLGQFYGGHFTGDYRTLKNEVSESAWTLGTNYQIADRFSLYGRYARGFQTNGQARVTHVAFGELGLRYESGPLAASLTGFHTLFRNFLFSRVPPGAADAVQISGDFKVTGAEFDATWRPSRLFQLQLLGVLQNSRLQVNGVVPFSYQTQLPAGAEDFARMFNGNRPERTPEVTFTLIPTMALPNGRGEIYVSYRYVGPIYADIANRFELPDYGIWNLGFTYDLTQQLRLSVSIDNLTNELALTEGNPRSGFDESAGVNDAFYARPMVGRNALISVTYDFTF